MCSSAVPCALLQLVGPAAARLAPLTRLDCCILTGGRQALAGQGVCGAAGPADGAAQARAAASSAAAACRRCSCWPGPPAAWPLVAHSAASFPSFPPPFSLQPARPPAGVCRDLRRAGAPAVHAVRSALMLCACIPLPLSTFVPSFLPPPQVRQCQRELNVAQYQGIEDRYRLQVPHLHRLAECPPARLGGREPQRHRRALPCPSTVSSPPSLPLPPSPPCSWWSSARRRWPTRTWRSTTRRAVERGAGTEGLAVRVLFKGGGCQGRARVLTGHHVRRHPPLSLSLPCTCRPWSARCCLSTPPKWGD